MLIVLKVIISWFIISVPVDILMGNLLKRASLQYPPTEDYNKHSRL